MSDKISTSELRTFIDGVKTPSLETFDALNPNSIKRNENIMSNPITSESVAMPAMPEKMTEEQLKKYNESVNEVVKGVAIRAKVEATRSEMRGGNAENIARYNRVADYAVLNNIVTREELNQISENVMVKENVQVAESVLKEVDSAIELAVAALKNIENFDPANFTEIYFVAMKLDAMLELKLDASTKHNVENALKMVHNVMELIEKKVEYNKIADEKDDKVKSPLSIISNLLAPKLNTSSL